MKYNRLKKVTDFIEETLPEYGFFLLIGKPHYRDTKVGSNWTPEEQIEILTDTIEKIKKHHGKL